MALHIIASNSVIAKLFSMNLLVSLYDKNTEVVNNVRKFEKYDFKYKKAVLDLDFLFTCKKKNIIPKFLRLKVANRQLQFSNTYNICVKDIIESRDMKQT